MTQKTGPDLEGRLETGARPLPSITSAGLEIRIDDGLGAGGAMLTEDETGFLP